MQPLQVYVLLHVEAMAPTNIVIFDLGADDKCPVVPLSFLLLNTFFYFLSFLLSFKVKLVVSILLTCLLLLAFLLLPAEHKMQRRGSLYFEGIAASFTVDIMFSKFIF